MKLSPDYTKDVGALQWSLIVICGLNAALGSWVRKGILVYGWKVPHWCTDNAISFRNLTSTQQRQIMTSSTLCSTPEVDFEQYTSDEILSLNFSAFNRTECQDMEYDHTYMDYTLTERFGLVCERQWLISLANTIYVFGYLVTGIITGALTDRYGRKLVAVACSCGSAGAQFLGAFAPILELYLLSRFLSAVFEFGKRNAIYILVIELLSNEQRVLPGLADRFMTALISFGFVGAVYLLRNYIYLHVLVGAIYSAMAVFEWWFLPESARWLDSVNRRGAALAVIARIAKFNRQSVDQLKHLSGECAQDSRVKTTYCDLFRTPVLRKRMIVCSVCWLTLMSVWFALLFNLGDFNPDVRLSIMTSSVLEFPVIMLMSRTVDKFGRQLCTFLYMLIAAMCCFFMWPLVHMTDSPWLLCLVLVGMTVANCQFVIMVLFISEIFPTVARAKAIAACSTLARLGVVAAPSIVLLNYYWAPAQVVILGVLATVAVVLIPILPATDGHDLPQTLADGEAFLAQHRYKLVLPSHKPRDQSHHKPRDQSHHKPRDQSQHKKRDQRNDTATNDHKHEQLKGTATILLDTSANYTPQEVEY